MADRYWGKLEFPAEMIDAEVTEALQEEGVKMDKLDPSESCYDYAWIEDGIFTLEDSEARYGGWEAVENLLRLKGIPFDRESGGYYDIIPELVIYRPARNGTPEQDLTFQLMYGEPVVRVKAIRELLNKTTSLFRGGSQREAAASAIERFLNEECPAYPPLTDARTCHHYDYQQRSDAL